MMQPGDDTPEPDDAGEALVSEMLAARVLETLGVQDDDSPESDTRWNALCELLKSELADARARGLRSAITPRVN